MPVASNEVTSMRKKHPRLIDFVCKYLPSALVALEVLEKIVELVNKVVNYAGPVRKFRLLV